MTNPWGDLKNTKLVWIEGSNLAECHPMGLKNVMKAREQNGTKIVHFDVRYTRTSKIADEFFQLRPGTDIAFMGYIISQMLEREKFNKDYVLRNTNAACLLRDDFSFQDGLFSGFDEAKKSYTNKESWGYALGADGKPQKANDLFAPTHKTNTLAKWTDAFGTFRRKWYVNMTKAWFGEHATAENDYGFNYGAIRNGNHPDSIYAIFEDAWRGTMHALYLCGQNPHVTNANAGLVHDGLCKMDSLVVQDIFVNETAEFWNRPGDNPADIQTEVIFLPACSYLEREGSITNSMRLIQWRMKGPDVLGDSKPDYEINDMLWKRIRELYADSTDKKDDPIKFMTWNYRKDHYLEDIMKEISGYDVATGTVVNGIGELKDNGETASGMWIYAGYYGREGNMTARRGQDDPGNVGIFPQFGWAWPDNLHILYNRASCLEDGSPADKEHPLVWWDAAAGKWTGYDVPDVGNRTAGPSTPAGQKPFRMNGEGFARIYAAPYKDKNPDGTTRDASSTPVDGPIPEHYEPFESPTHNAMHENENAQHNPCIKYPRLPEKQPIGTKDKFPYVLCSSGIAEHWCSGTVTRNIPWLNELVKENFVEISEQLAKKIGVKAGDKVKVSSARSEIVVKAMVTKRAQPLKVNGEETHMVWMPYSFGFKGLSTGPSTNYLTNDALDPNSEEQEFKACLVNVQKA